MERTPKKGRKVRIERLERDIQGKGRPETKKISEAMLHWRHNLPTVNACLPFAISMFLHHDGVGRHHRTSRLSNGSIVGSGATSSKAISNVSGFEG